MLADCLAAEFDDRCIECAQAFGAFAVLDHVDDCRRDADLQGFGFVRRPFESAVHLARHREDRDLADFRIEAGLVTQIPVDRIVRFDRLRAVQMDARRAAQTDDGLARRIGAVIGALADLVQILALAQRQAAARLRIDICRHFTPLVCSRRFAVMPANAGI